MKPSILPAGGSGRRTAEQQAVDAAQVKHLCDLMIEINSRSEFPVSARGWCYLLESHGLDKGDFDRAENLINACRKDGRLPLEICAMDEGRIPSGIEQLDNPDPKEETDNWLRYMRSAHTRYTPIPRWAGQRYYVEMAVEKLDLKSLFAPVCARYGVVLSNFSGWTDLNSRAAMLLRFVQHEQDGRTPVLLYCGDLDPGGVHISGKLMKILRDMEAAAGGFPRELSIDCFGLNADFIKAHNLTWIDGLTTGAKTGNNRLDDPDHNDHTKPYVQDYMRMYGPRKCEANALVVIPEAARELCEAAILRYFDVDADADYDRRLAGTRKKLKTAIDSALAKAAR